MLIDIIHAGGRPFSAVASGRLLAESSPRNSGRALHVKVDVNVVVVVLFIMPENEIGLVEPGGIADRKFKTGAEAVFPGMPRNRNGFFRTNPLPCRISAGTGWRAGKRAGNGFSNAGFYKIAFLHHLKERSVPVPWLFPVHPSSIPRLSEYWSHRLWSRWC